MPTANIADFTGKAHTIYYVDSGPVPGSNDYHTIFLNHGSAFNSFTFNRIMPLAAKYNLRFVCPNRRGYNHSEDYTDEEVEQVKAGHNIVLQNLGVEATNFWLWFIENHNLPKLSEDRRSGGVSVLGWSMGSAYTVAALGQTEAVSPEVYSKLEPWISNLVVYDSPSGAFGTDYPNWGYVPIFDPEVLATPSEMERISKEWLSSYWKHSPEVFKSPNREGLDKRRIGDRPTFKNMTEEEIAEGINWIAAIRIDVGFQDYTRWQSHLAAQANKALYDEESAKTILPKLKVLCITCESTLFTCVWATTEALVKYQELTKLGRKIRPTNFVVFPQHNHFGHWDDPELFMQSFDKAMRGLHA